MKRQRNRYRIIFVAGTLLLAGLCLGIALITIGSGLTLWLTFNRLAESSTATPRLARRAVAIPLVTPLATTPSAGATSIAASTPTETPTPPPLPTGTATPTPLPPSATPTPLLATARSSPPPPPATATPAPTATPVSTFPFSIAETGQFPTNHLDFDVYVAITDANNKPLGGYRLLGHHSDGRQVESGDSSDDWTVNSGAMHYKAGNIKYSVPNSPGGTWTLQLVDTAEQPVAPPVEFSFDSSNPTWYFLLYKRLD